LLIGSVGMVSTPQPPAAPGVEMKWLSPSEISY
jgi:hypothetical protein